MKKKIKYLMIILSLIVFYSCDLLDPTAKVEARIDAFESDLNSEDYSRLQDNFHPSMISYDSYNSEAIIASGFLSVDNAPFSFGVPSVSGSGSTYTAYGTFSNSVPASGTYTAVMKEYSGEWLIYELNVTIGVNTATIKTLK